MSQPSGPFRISPFLQTKLCYVGQKEIFAEGQDSLKELGGITITAKQIERVSHYWGEEIGLIEEQAAMNKLERAKGLHYVMIDGAMILSREDSWKETKLGRIFPSSALHSLGNEENSRGWLRSSNYTAHIGNCHDFFDKFSTKVDLLEHFICIGDGAKWIWNWCTINYPNAVKILDYWHATERMWKFVKSLYSCEKQQLEWMKEQEALLWEDGIEEVIENIAQIKTRKLKAKEEQQKIQTYLTNHKDKMKYKTYEENGWLVGSGAIESAHRTVIQKRLKLSGQRWTIAGAQQILNLRVVHKNNNWQSLIHTIANAC